MDPLTRGGLFHTVQFRLLTLLSEADLLPVTTQNSAAVRVMADDCLDRAASEYREELAPPIDRIWNNDVEDLRTDLHGWLRMLARDPESTGWTPIHFEYGFGLHRPGERDPASTAREATILGGVHLRGAIDLIEERARGGLLRVVDHKTGRVPAPAPNVTGGGRFLQPLLYALVAESLFERRVATADLYYCTERGGFRRVTISIDERSRNVIENAIGLIDRSVDAVFLTAAPEAAACTRCDFRVVCGPYEETRTRNKHSRGDEPAVWAQGLVNNGRCPEPDSRPRSTAPPPDIPGPEPHPGSGGRHRHNHRPG
jgi:CRISPR/Cas system-associated exonuclease Cas4 (RecB family)